MYYHRRINRRLLKLLLQVEEKMYMQCHYWSSVRAGCCLGTKSRPLTNKTKAGRPKEIEFMLRHSEFLCSGSNSFDLTFCFIRI